MRIHFATLESCAEATGTVVSVDVLRAFTTAAFALANGATEILLVGTVDEAFALRAQIPDALVMGEVGGYPVPGFDFDNSPSKMAPRALAGRRLIQRTTAGTQGIVRSVRAERLYAASFVCAEATAECLLRDGTTEVTLVVTGQLEERDGDEDWACAELLAARLRGERPDPRPFLSRVARSTAGRKFHEPGHPVFPAEDLALATDLDRFPFALRVTREGAFHVLRAAAV